MGKAEHRSGLAKLLSWTVAVCQSNREQEQRQKQNQLSITELPTSLPVSLRTVAVCQSSLPFLFLFSYVSGQRLQAHYQNSGSMPVQKVYFEINLYLSGLFPPPSYPKGVFTLRLLSDYHNTF